MQLASACKHVDAFDISPGLIEQANVHMKSLGISNIKFKVKDLQNMGIEKTYDAVSCMGVLLTIPDEVVLIRTINELIKATKDGGYLIFKDSVCLEQEPSITVINPNGYPACYRNEIEYESLFEERGLKKVFSYALNRVYFLNRFMSIKMYVFKK